MSIKKQIEKYFEYNLEISGDLFFFDESPPKPRKNISRLNKTYENIPKDPNNNLDNNIKNNISICESIPAQNKPDDSKLDNAPQMQIIDSNNQNITSNLNLNLKLENICSLDELQVAMENCQRCGLGATRNKLVFGSGNPNADLLIIGEAPGAEEDLKGEPFVGRAGQLLTDILLAINFKREDVYIANICKCRPPGNRRPSLEEVYCCETYLKKQIEIISPKFILALGLTAADALFKKTHKMAEIRGRFLDYNGIKTMVTYHPAALLRNPSWKRPVWEDVQLLRKMYDTYQTDKK